jgi:hypothetical protein
MGNQNVSSGDRKKGIMKSFARRLKQSQHDRQVVTVKYRVKGDSKHRIASMKRCEVPGFLKKFRVLEECEVTP